MVPLSAQSVRYVAGRGIGDESKAKYAPLSPGALYSKADGRLYFTDLGNQKIRYIRLSDETVHTLPRHIPACNEWSEENQSCLETPRGLDFSLDDDIFLSDLSKGRLFKYSISEQEFTQIYPPLLQNAYPEGVVPEFQNLVPYGLDISQDQKLLVCDTSLHQVLQWDFQLNEFTLLAGTGIKGFSGDGGPGHLAKLNTPTEILAWDESKLLILDGGNHCIRLLDLALGTIETIAGKCKDAGYTPESTSLEEARFKSPEGFGMDNAGNLYVADEWNHVVRKIDFSAGTVSTVAGNHTPGYSGDEGLATEAQLRRPQDVAVDVHGNLYISDLGNKVIRKVDAQTQKMYTLAGTGNQFYCQDTTSWQNACFKNVSFLAFAPDGDLWISDSNNHRFGRLDQQTGQFVPSIGLGVKSTQAGDPSANLDRPKGFAFDSEGNLFLADTFNARVLYWDAQTQRSTTILGEGGLINRDTQGNRIEDIIQRPYDLIFNDSILYISDVVTHHVLQLDLKSFQLQSLNNPTDRPIGPDTSSNLYRPLGIELQEGYIYVADAGNRRISRIDLATKEIVGILGGGQHVIGQEFSPSLEAKLNEPFDICRDGQGNFFISDSKSASLYFFNPQELQVRLLNTLGSFRGDQTNQALQETILFEPKGLALSKQGELFIAEQDVIRKVSQLDEVFITGPDTVCTQEVYEYTSSLGVEKNLQWDVRGGEMLNDPREKSIRVRWFPGETLGSITLEVNSGLGFPSSYSRSIHIEGVALAEQLILPQTDFCPQDAPLFLPNIAPRGEYILEGKSLGVFDPRDWAPGEYVLSYQSVPGLACTEVVVDTLKVWEIPPVEALQITSTTQLLCPGDKGFILTIPGYSNLEWNWFRVGQAEALAEKGNSITLNQAGEYWAQAEHPCLNLRTNPIKIKELQVYVPELFTPNGDKVNDWFTVCVNYPEQVEALQVEIFHPNGQRVYSTNDPSEALCKENPQEELGWGGDNQPTGLYIWRVKLQTKYCSNLIKSGKIYLKR